MPAESLCPSCGAPSSGYVCPYCGIAVTATSDADSQLHAVSELHDLISKSGRTRKVELLKNGFLPDHPRALIEAGLKCIPHINPYDINQAVSAAAIHRLKAINAKLKLLPSDEEILKAISEFESIIGDFDSRAKWDTVYGALAVVAIAIVAIVYLIFFR